MKCIGPEAKDADLLILVEVRRIHQEGILLEVEHVKAHRSQIEKQDMTLFRTPCLRQPDFTVWWKNGKIVKRSRQSQKKSGSKVEAEKHRTERCASSSLHLCMRCGRNSKKMKMPGKCGRA